MVAEDSETKKTELGNAETVENDLPAPSAGNSGAQIALAFDSEGNHALVSESPSAHDGRQPKRKQPRFDTRRTAEYLAERGRLPAEALHLITRRTLKEAVEYIRKAVPGSSHVWAAEYYARCIAMLLPYCHLQQSDLDGAGGAEGVHNLVASHFLAASALRASTTIDAVRGGGAAGSFHVPTDRLDSRRLFDQTGQRDHAAVNSDISRGVGSADHAADHPTNETTQRATVVTLPPRGRD